MFIDIARIQLKAGDGGNGCQSVRRDRRKRHPRRDGGDGGNGGDIRFCADSKIHTLLDFRFRQHFRAKSGGHGSSKNKRGKDATDSIIKVPCGTIIRDSKLGLLLRDLKESGEEVIVVKGGRGGRGNVVTKALAERGAGGQEREVHLELKFIADVAIVGLPNAGKSSLIRVLSGAKPKVASYPFTTKSPNLGSFREGDLSFIFVDVPGLIEGAHSGRGLGDKFLRHIERTRLVLQLIDVSPAAAVEAPAAYKIIDKELKLYIGNLEDKPRIVVGNKIDLGGAEVNLKKLEQELGSSVISISCLEKKGLERLIDEIRQRL